MSHFKKRLAECGVCVVAGGVWICLVALSLAWNWYAVGRSLSRLAESEARGSHQKDVVYRRWVALQGGVYVPPTEQVPPNPYLAHVPSRDVVTMDGSRLTLVNPAYMTRLVQELGREQYGIPGHLTSLAPLRSENGPDAWEAQGLRAFETGAAEWISEDAIDGQPFLRLMKPFVTEASCLKCHAAQGYKVGDIRGGIAVAVPLAPYRTAAVEQRIQLTAAHLLIGGLGLVGLWLGSARLLQQQSQLERQNESLRLSEERHRLVIESASTAVWDWDVSGRRVQFSPKWFAQRGRSPDGAGDGEEEWSRDVHPDDLPRVMAAVERHFEGETPVFAEEYRVLHADGTWRWVLDRGLAERDAAGRVVRMVGSQEDITARKQAEHLLEESLARFRSLTEVSLVGVWATDAVGNNTYVSPRWSEITGIPPELARGAGWSSGIHPDDRDRTYVEWKRASLEAQPYVSEFRFVHPCGRIVWVLCQAIAVTQSDGKIVEWIGTIFDVTERKAADEALRQHRDLLEQRVLERTAELEQQIARASDLAQLAEAASRAKSRFTAHMSHEIRTPMNAVLGFVQLLARDPTLTPGQAAYVQTISRSAENLLSLLNEVLDLSKIEAGQTELRPEDFDVHHLLDEMDAMFRASMAAKGLEFLVERDPDLPAVVHGDRGKLQRILVNLLSNAVKFTRAGRVLLRVRRAGPEPSENPTAIRLWIDVQDTGPGISDHDQDHLFDPYYQTAAGTRAGGTGLGLSISREYARLMGGQLAVASQLGTGATFRLDVPLQLVTDEIRPGKTRRRVSALEPGSGPWRILAVDDNPDNLALLTALLRPVGFQVREAANGADALQIFREWSPQAVLLDVRMPVLDGYEVAQRMKAAPGGPGTLIITVSAAAFDDFQIQGREAGVDAHLAKPFQAEELFQVLAEGLDLRYVYAEDRSSAMTGRLPVRTDLPSADPFPAKHPLSLADVQAIHQAVLEGDVERLLELIDQVAQEDAPAAQVLRSMAENFDYEGLGRWLRGVEKAAGRSPFAAARTSAGGER